MALTPDEIRFECFRNHFANNTENRESNVESNIGSYIYVYCKRIVVKCRMFAENGNIYELYHSREKKLANNNFYLFFADIWIRMLFTGWCCSYPFLQIRRDDSGKFKKVLILHLHLASPKKFILQKMRVNPSV